MLSAQYAKIWNDVISSKTRTLLIILSIVVGLTAVGTVLNARTRLDQSIETVYREIDYAHGVIVTGQSFDKDFAPALSDTEGVDGIDARRMIAAQAVNKSGKRVSINISTIRDFGDMRVNRVEPVRGEWPPSRHHILIDNSGMAMLEAQVGDSIMVELAGGDRRTLEIAGVVNDRSQPPAIFLNAVSGCVDEDTMVWLGQPAGYNQLFITVPASDPEKEEIQTVLNAVTDRVEKAGYTVTTSQAAAEIPIATMLDMLMYILTGIGGLSLFLSIFLIINTISAMIAQQTRQVGVMKALGGSGQQILWMYLSVVIFYGLTALAISIPLAVVGGHFLSKYVLAIFSFEAIGSPIQATSILIQTAIGVFGPTLASLLPLSNGLRISATQALSSDSAGQASKAGSLIDRVLSGKMLWMTRFVLLRPMILAMRNMFRRKIRLALTLATLVLAGTVFISIFNLRATIFASLGKITQMQSYDLTVNFYRPYRNAHIFQALEEVPGVQAVDTRMSTSVKRVRPDRSESDTMTMEGIRLDSKVVSAPSILEGRWLQPGDEQAVVITSPMLQNEPDLEVGQVIFLKIYDRSIPFVIIGEAMGTSMGIGGGTVYVNAGFMEGIISTPYSSTSAKIKLDAGTGTTTAEMINRLDAKLKADGFQLASIQTTNQDRKSMENNFTSILVLLVLMALLLAIVGGMGLMGTMSINVIERTREIGVLRAIGASNRGVTGVFMLEGVSIGIISCLFSIPLSYPITDLVSSSIGALATGSPWASTYTPVGIFIWAVVILILSLAANYLPARSASRLTVREVLAYE